MYKQTTKHNNVMHFLVMKKQEISYFISNNVITKLSFLESKNQREIKEQSNQYQKLSQLQIIKTKLLKNLIFFPKEQSKTLSIFPNQEKTKRRLKHQYISDKPTPLETSSYQRTKQRRIIPLPTPPRLSSFPAKG